MKVADSHTDFLTEIKSKKEREIYIKNIKRTAKTICSAVFTSKSEISVKNVENYSHEINCYNKKYKTNLLLTIEDLGFVKNEKELNKVIKLKPLAVTLMWNFKNQFAGGALSNGGITTLGKKTIKKLEENSILVDTAHLNKKSFWQFVNLTKFPIFNSHSNIFALKRHKRNLTDKQIQAIVDSNGFLGITLYDKFISDKKITAKDVALQFDYLIKKFGYKNFGFGTNFYGIDSSHLPDKVNSYLDLKSIMLELKKFGHSKKVIKHLMYKNFEMFIKRIKSNKFTLPS